MGDLYGIVANVLEPDKVFSLGAKAWLANGTGGEGWERFEWLARAKGGRLVLKWAPTTRFHRFRCKWIPEHLRDRVSYMTWIDRRSAEVMAVQLATFADAARIAHPNRRI